MSTLPPIRSPQRSDPAPRSAFIGRRLAQLSRKLLPIGLFAASCVLLIVLLGFAQRRGWIAAPGKSGGTSAAKEGATHTCPMHPQIRQPGAGRCPICGMELVPAASAVADLDELSVRIEPAQRRLANIQTAEVESSPVDDVRQTVGVLAIDESRQATIAAYVDGRLERLYADYTGVRIKQGDHLAILYSPQLYAAQVEYIEARRALGAASIPSAVLHAQQTLATNTRQRLREFGMTEEQLAELEGSGRAQSRLTIYAPQGGTVVEKLAVEGDYVEAGDPIYRIAELSTVWLMLKLFPEDAARVRFGPRVEAAIHSLPGEKLLGRVAFIDPTVDPKTRTVGVRVELLNDGRLRPGDYAEARVILPIGPQGDVYDADLAGKWISPMHPQIVRDAPGQCPVCGMDLVPTTQYGYAEKPTPQPSSLHVPRSAVLMAGDESVVYVETSPGVFEIRRVALGPILRERIVVLSGLESGEKVATAGNFLIDSQMQLAGKPSLIDASRAVDKAPQRKGPLTFDRLQTSAVGGEAGAQLESLFVAYFEVQRALASDQRPPTEAAQAFHQRARTLSSVSELPPSSRSLLQEAAEKSAHLHDLDLVEARQAFKPISHAVVTLATQVRSEQAQRPFTHFFCPMVPGGGGDWLQADGELRNPYFGSEMLRCGDKVQVFPPAGSEKGASS